MPSLFINLLIQFTFSFLHPHRLKSRTVVLLTIASIVCCSGSVQAFTELAKLEDQPTHFESREIGESLPQVAATSEARGPKEQPTHFETRSGGNLPAADQLNPRFELPPSQFPNSRQLGGGQPANALETALSGYGSSVRKSPQFPTDPYGSNAGSLNSPAGGSVPPNYQRQPQMISVLSGGASLHQSVSWNGALPANLNPQSQAAFNPNTFSSSSSSSSSSSNAANQSPFSSFNSAVNSAINSNTNHQSSNGEFVPSSAPKVHESNDFASHDIHVNSRPHNLPHQDLSREISRDASPVSGAPLQNSRQFDNLQSVPASSPVEKPAAASENPKPKPAHTVVKNGDGKKDDVVIYYYYYYDDDKNKTGGSTVSPVDVIPSLDQYDNVAPKKPSVSVVESTQQPPAVRAPVNHTPERHAPERHAPERESAAVPAINNKPTEFKIDGNTFKFDTTGFTPITTTPSPYAAFRAPTAQDRGVHVHNNPLYGSANGKTLRLLTGALFNFLLRDDNSNAVQPNFLFSLLLLLTSPQKRPTIQKKPDRKRTKNPNLN